MSVAVDESQVIRTISPDDLMYQHDPDYYFEYGRGALHCIRLAQRAAGRPTVGSILDFPCGHGRVLRSLKAAFPSARLDACDIDGEAVAFCADTFGVEPIQSAEDPSEIRLGSYDLIWCGSLFTHLDASRWPDFLQLFTESLTPEGILVFTTAGHACARFAIETGRPRSTEASLAAFSRSGFGYDEYEPSLKNTLGLSDYGQSFSSLRWVLGQLEGFPLRVVMASEGAWTSQDVIACLPDRPVRVV